MLISKPFHSAQKFVDSIGMYRVVSASLVILALLSVLCGFFGLIAYSGLELLMTLVSTVVIALVLNGAIGQVTKISVNQESALITALILFFLFIPAMTFLDNWPLWLATFIAIVSKYLFVWKKQHLANPAAIGAAVVSATGLYISSWWVANPTLFIPLVILGCLVVMKVRKWTPVFAFVGVSFVLFFVESLMLGDILTVSLSTFFFSWPTLFLAFFMLTEPFTMPARKEQQILYGGLVAFLSNASVASVFFTFTPELALVVANVLLIGTRLSQKLVLEFVSKSKIAKDTYEYVFKKPAGFTFLPGQYLEWMLPHRKADSRGPRRYFTIASSPTEGEVRLAMKLVEKGSSYKQSLHGLDIGKKIIASQLAGDFLLPKKPEQKLALVAGGIGITPFRSHVKYMMDSGVVHDTVLYYCANTKDEVAYRELFKEASKKFTFSTIEVIAKEQVVAPDENGFLTADMIKNRTPDYLERHWYLSGPPGMVNAYSKLLSELGVPKKNITRDFFPGLA